VEGFRYGVFLKIFFPRVRWELGWGLLPSCVLSRSSPARVHIQYVQYGVETFFSAPVNNPPGSRTDSGKNFYHQKRWISFGNYCQKKLMETWILKVKLEEYTLPTQLVLSMRLPCVSPRTCSPAFVIKKRVHPPIPPTGHPKQPAI
jgi:hypothetical protein